MDAAQTLQGSEYEIVRGGAERTERMCGVADLNCDGHANGPDLGLLLGAWGQVGAAFDLTGDNHTDGADVGVLLGAWGNGAMSSEYWQL